MGKLNTKSSLKIAGWMMLFLLILGGNCKKDSDCPDQSHNSIRIYNNSLKVINYRLFKADSIYKINGSPEPDQLVSPNSYKDYNIRNETCWEGYFTQVYNGYEFLLIFDDDTVDAIGWYAINGTNRGILKIIKVDLKYLQDNYFTISYP